VFLSSLCGHVTGKPYFSLLNNVMRQIFCLRFKNKILNMYMCDQRLCLIGVFTELIHETHAKVLHVSFPKVPSIRAAPDRHWDVIARIGE
jgi:hypothetical protein